MSLISNLSTRLFSLSREEASFERRRFPGCNSASRPHLERVIQTFIEGYNLALATSEMKQLASRLDSFPPTFSGFGYEGAGLFFALADLMVPRSASRLAEFTQNVAPRHDFITMVGAGFAIARVPFGLRRLASYQAKLDPMTGWCLTDGYGFHQGFFHWDRFIERRESPPASFDRQKRALFDAGVGRAMWWVFGADLESIASAISKFTLDRQPEMWAGIGTALAYANGSPDGSLPGLCELSGGFRADLLSGIPFAAHMRVKGENPAPWTDKACLELLGVSVTHASRVVERELEAYLTSWQGTEQAKWNHCYLGLRERVKLCLADPERYVTHSLSLAPEVTNNNDNY
jgi:hypothetical protein